MTLSLLPLASAKKSMESPSFRVTMAFFQFCVLA